MNVTASSHALSRGFSGSPTPYWARAPAPGDTEASMTIPALKELQSSRDETY